MIRILRKDFSEVEERLYSTGNDELDELLERAFCEGYEYAQREFSNAAQKEMRRAYDASIGRTIRARVNDLKETGGVSNSLLDRKDSGGLRYRNSTERNISRGRTLMGKPNWANAENSYHASHVGKHTIDFVPSNTVNKIPGNAQHNKQVILNNLGKK